MKEYNQEEIDDKLEFGEEVFPSPAHEWIHAGEESDENFDRLPKEIPESLVEKTIEAAGRAGRLDMASRADPSSKFVQEALAEFKREVAIARGWDLNAGEYAPEKSWYERLWQKVKEYF
ncbi:MAG: hypothetical protein KKA65_05005 [Nanoarchaeota archaeon]|nr:hypothetical protein [Nanoarchaeota archaeon]MBU4241923.1 hypothetical protein [Nanoarchaeota archaeon]MBU4351978.1 hypothetical protein [Nanoarchaeota archaeon]MBU4456834.1 hypothetical protein [Nanoarchaeota archaeon]MCG2719864.1 hypothetical protein [Nanoarchaeota archaeon]